MARIPISQRGAQLGRAPAVQMQQEGAATGQALERLGAVGVQAGIGMAADQTRLQAEEMRQQQALAEAARKARDQAVLGELDDGMNDLAAEVADGIRTGTLPKDKAETTFNERAGKLTGEKLKSLSADDARVTVQPLVGRLQSRLGNGVRKAVEDRNRQDVTADMQTQLERLQRQYSADPQRTEAVAMALFDNLGPHSVLNPVQLSEARQRWMEGAQFSVGDAAVRAARLDPGAMKRAQETLSGLPQLDPQKRVQLEDRLMNYGIAHQQQQEFRAQRAARESEARMRRAGAEFETFQALADKGAGLAPEYVDRVVAATAGTPYQAGVRALAQQAAAIGGFAAQPLATQRAALDAIDAQIAQGGRTPEIDRRREQVAKVVTAAQGDVSRDPLRAGLERGVIEALPPLDLTKGLPGLAETMQARVMAAQRVGAWAGQPVAPVTADEAQGLAKLLHAMAPDTKGSALGILAQTMPPEQGQALARLLDARDRPLALAIAAGASQTTQGRFTAELILRGQQAMRDKSIKVEGGAEFGLKAQVAKEIGDSVPGQARDDLIDAATLIYVGKQAEGNTISMQGAVRLALGGDILEHNGRRVPVPAGMDGPALQQKLLRMPERAISQQASDGFVYIPGGRPMGVPEFLAALPGAQLEPAGLGRYVVRSGSGLVMNADRRPIVIDVR